MRLIETAGNSTFAIEYEACSRRYRFVFWRLRQNLQGSCLDSQRKPPPLPLPATFRNSTFISTVSFRLISTVSEAYVWVTRNIRQETHCEARLRVHAEQ